MNSEVYCAQIKSQQDQTAQNVQHTLIYKNDSIKHK